MKADNEMIKEKLDHILFQLEKLSRELDDLKTSGLRSSLKGSSAARDKKSSYQHLLADEKGWIRHE